MLRTDGLLIPLDEDQFLLDRVWKDLNESGVVTYYFGWRTSVAQALRMVDPSSPIELTRLEWWGEDSKWVGLEEAPSMKSTGEVVQWLVTHCDRGDLINFECRIGNEVDLDSHDDTEVSLQGPEGSWIHDWAEALLASRGFKAKVILDALEESAGKYLAIGRPDVVLGVYDTFDDLHKAHRER
ncbi:MAG TPA: hypothetical protein VL181_10285 [Holophagaceae bacterium]|nr:hypothetical protein [Holophagaceae bacterium]